MSDQNLLSLPEALRKILGIEKEVNFYAVLNGPTGSGKTIFTYHMLWSYLQEGRKVAYSSTEDSAPHIIQKMKAFGWDIQPFITSGNLALVDLYSWRVDNVTDPSKTPYGVRICPLNVEHMSTANSLIHTHLNGEPSRQLYDCLTTVLVDIDFEKHLETVRSMVSRTREGSIGIATMTKGILPERLENSLLTVFDIIVEARLVYGAEPKRHFRITKSNLGPHPTEWYPYKITSKGYEIYAPES